VNTRNKNSKTSEINGYREGLNNNETAEQIRRDVYNRHDQTDEPIFAIAIRVPANIEDSHALHAADEALYEKLEESAFLAPLHIPAATGLAKSCEKVFFGIPVIFVFDSAFFNDLPEREKVYAIDPLLVKGRSLKRQGYHGILHSAASRMVVNNRRRQGIRSTPEIVSICLEPRPEAAAIYGQKPVMVTSGATPLEGLMGDTSCGDIDAGILTAMANEFKWGPERINRLLTEESGFSGMAQKRVTLSDLFEDSGKDMENTREMFLYRLLGVCGSAIAAMGSIDSIVFSGRYRSVGEKIGPWLEERLSFIRRPTGKPELSWSIYQYGVDVAVSEKVEKYLAENIFLPRVQLKR
jgi:acetate kinase